MGFLMKHLLTFETKREHEPSCCQLLAEEMMVVMFYMRSKIMVKKYSLTIKCSGV